MESIWYPIEVSTCITAFYCLYLTIFRHMTFFAVNRLYLSVCLVIAFIIPILNFSWVPTDYHTISSELKSIEIVQEWNADAEIVFTDAVSTQYSIVALAYWIGVLFFLGRLLHSIYKITTLRHSGNAGEGNSAIVYANTPEPFTFFNKIFLPSGGVSPLILAHEQVHVSHKHWIDLLLVEIASIVLWFNPIMVFYRWSIKVQHEYAADAYVLRKVSSLETYLDCIVFHLHQNSFAGPVNHFYSKHIKQRIFMMTKQKTSFPFSVMYVLIAPVVCLLLFAFSNPSRTVYYDTNIPKNVEHVIIVDAGHGGSDTGAMNHNGDNEKELVLSLARSIQQAAKAKNIKVVLTRNNDEAVSLEDRVGVTKQYGADLFISLHANFDEQDPSTSGIECLVSETNVRFSDSKRIAENFIKELGLLKEIAVNGVKQTNAYVLSKNTSPAVMLELGYLSNKSDRAYMMNPANQKRISERIISVLTKEFK
jgi:N-acetylmuramoyl-L-alanine amidase